MSAGSHEPDNGLDSSAFMFFNPPGAATNRVYFNGWATVSGGANPNVGALSTHNEIPTAETYNAILGVWVDCNGDGYVGMAEGALREYDNALLIDKSICPATIGPVNSWSGHPNYNGWVSELIPIGGSGGDGPIAQQNGGTNDDGGDKRIIRDHDARVWMDYGIWNLPASSGQGTCALNPQPRGTYSSTGGIINFIECSPGLLEAWNRVFRDGQPVGGVGVIPAADPSNSLGLHYHNSNEARQSGHPLHIATFGDEDASGSAAYVADCGGADTFNSGDTFNGTGLRQPIRDATNTDPAVVDNLVVVHALDPRLGSPSDPVRSGPATLNMTNEEVRGDCDYSNDRGADFYGILEGDFDGVSNTDKRSAGRNFQFSDIPRARTPPFSVIHGGSAGMHDLAGVDSAPFNFGGDWSGGATLIKTTGPRSVAASAAQGTVAVANAYFISYYAYVGATTTGAGFVTPGGVGTYGGPQCGGATSGVHNGWNCNPSTWYINPDGSPMPEPSEQPTLTRVGQTYNLRDVDCYDGNNGVGVPLGAPAFGPNPCPAAP